MPRYMSAAAAAEILDLKPNTVSEYCKRGLLPGAVKIRRGSPWRIPETALEAFTTPEQPGPLAPRNARSTAQQGRRRRAA